MANFKCTVCRKPSDTPVCRHCLEDMGLAGRACVRPVGVTQRIDLKKKEGGFKCRGTTKGKS